MESKLAEPVNMSGPPENLGEVQALFEQMGPALDRALPRHMDAGRLARVALTAIRNTPRLLDCTRDSLLASLMQAAQLGLEPDGMLGHAALVPFKSECTLLVMYQGFIELAYRSDGVASISADVVFEADEFEYERGLDERLVHRPTDEDDPGEVTHAYAICRFTNGGRAWVCLNRRDIERHRSYSRQRDGELWTEHYPQAARKTALRELAKFIPQSPTMQRAASIDGGNESGFGLQAEDFIATVDLPPEVNAARAADRREGERTRAEEAKARAKAAQQARRSASTAQPEAEPEPEAKPARKKASRKKAGKKTGRGRSRRAPADEGAAAADAPEVTDAEEAPVEPADAPEVVEGPEVDDALADAREAETAPDSGEQAEEPQPEPVEEPEEGGVREEDPGTAHGEDEPSREKLPPKPRNAATKAQVAAILRMHERYGVDMRDVTQMITRHYQKPGAEWLTREEASELISACEDGSVYDFLDELPAE